MVGFATMTVLLIAGVLLVLGALLLGSGVCGRRRLPCPHCGHDNARAAQYCGQCGEKLRSG